jgi:aspartyl/glutamyl-tRNA(Asn/Gln) amidotransferase C subunit
MEKKEKIQKLLQGIKLEVEDINSFEKDIDSILNMFDELKNVEVTDVSGDLNRKKISITDLRQDIPSETQSFRPEMKGKYFKVPTVSKKDKQ